MYSFHHQAALSVGPKESCPTWEVKLRMTCSGFACVLSQPSWQEACLQTSSVQIRIYRIPQQFPNFVKEIWNLDRLLPVRRFTSLPCDFQIGSGKTVSCIAFDDFPVLHQYLRLGKTAETHTVHDFHSLLRADHIYIGREMFIIKGFGKRIASDRRNYFI